MQETGKEIVSNKSIYSRLVWEVFFLENVAYIKLVTSFLVAIYIANLLKCSGWSLKKESNVFSIKKDIAESNPNSTYIFEPSLINDHYPKGPSDFASVCLHECEWI